MRIGGFFYQLHELDGSGRTNSFLGTAFPVVPEGGLLTCRHCVEAFAGHGSLAIHDPIARRFRRIPDPVLSQHRDIDLAFVRDAMPGKQEFIPILPTELSKIGEHVYTFGFFKLGAEIENGYFAGPIVNMKVEREKDAHHILPFAVLEGMSGSPILTYHNGPKLIGVARGNRQSRLLASDVIDVEENGKTLRETIHRVVEFGIAIHAAAVVDFLTGIGVTSYVKTGETVGIQGLE